MNKDVNGDGCKSACKLSRLGMETASNSFHCEFRYKLDTGSRAYWTAR